MSRLATILILLLVLLLAGCASKGERFKAYEGELPANHVAVIEAPTQLEVFEVSGVRVKTLFISGSRYEVDVPAGEQFLLVQYVASWSEQGERSEGDVLRSYSVRIDADLRGGQRYQLAYRQPQSFAEANRFAEKPVIWLEDDNGKRVAEGVIRPKAQQGSLRRGPSVAAARPASSAPETGAAAESPRASGQQAVLPAAPAATSQAYKRLQYWWEQATPEDRAAFEAWMRQR